MMRPDTPARGPWLAKWHETVAPLSARSSRVVMAFCAAFAAPLCGMAGVRPFLVHLYGPPGEGEYLGDRQALLRLPDCVYGRDQFHMSTWHALARSGAWVNDETEDGLLLLSRFDEAPHGEVIDAAGARWFDRRGDVPAKSAWRRDRVALSCGSMPIDPALLRKAKELGKAWILNVPTDALSGHGMYEVATSPMERCVLDMAADDCAGRLGVLWLAHLNREGRAIAERWRAEEGFAEMRILEPTTQLSYVELAASFSRLATAGEEATRAGLTGWVPGTAQAAGWRCFEAMLLEGARRAGVPPDAAGVFPIDRLPPDDMEHASG